MPNRAVVSPDKIRMAFSDKLSAMFRAEVPQYSRLLQIVAEVNASSLGTKPDLQRNLESGDRLARISSERHGAIRLGSASELSTMRRLFAIMGMKPVGYYDLTAAGIPVHSTAFRPIDSEALARCPFRVFTSLLRLDLFENAALRDVCKRILGDRDIFSPRLYRLIESAEAHGLTAAQAHRICVRSNRNVQVAP